MGFIFLGLVVGSLVFVLGLIAGKLKNGRIYKAVVPVISSLVLAGFISKMFVDAEKIFYTLIIMLGILSFMILPMALSSSKNSKCKVFLILNAMAIVITGIALGLVSGSGYEDEANEIKTVELIECNFNYDDVKKTFYVYEDDLNYICLNLNSNTNKMEEVKVNKKQAKIDESDSCLEPQLVIYERKAKRTFWTLGFGKKTEYVFYVPTGTISKDMFS